MGAARVTFTNLTDYVIGVFRFEHVAVEELDLEEVARTVARTLGVHLRTVDARRRGRRLHRRSAPGVARRGSPCATRARTCSRSTDVPEEEISAALEPLKLVYPTDPPPRVIYVEYVVTLRGARTRAPRSCGRAPSCSSTSRTETSVVAANLMKATGATVAQVTEPEISLKATLAVRVPTPEAAQRGGMLVEGDLKGGKAMEEALEKEG